MANVTNLWTVSGEPKHGFELLDGICMPHAIVI
jgi:hypothetical protein